MFTIKQYFTAFLLMLGLSAGAQSVSSEVNNIAYFCKVWGFLKYYHPVVASGKLDWDAEFVNHVNQVAAFKSGHDVNLFYRQWIESIGTVIPCKTCSTEIVDSLSYNLNISFISDTTYFDDQTIALLTFIFENRNQSKNYYVSQSKFVGNTFYANENPYNDSIYPGAPMRLLALSRYWNIINYFYPYKNIIGKDWNEELTEMIPRFRDAGDTIEYHVALLETIASIHDSHANFATKYTRQFLGYKWVPFKFSIIDNKAIVTGFYSDSLAAKDDICYGDIFLNIGGQSVSAILCNKRKYLSASNEAVLARESYYTLFTGNSDSVLVTFDRSGKIMEKYIHRYYFTEFNYEWALPDSSEHYKKLPNNIGYVNMGALTRKETRNVLKDLSSTRAIIFDVRNYPKGTYGKVTRYLNPDLKPFAYFSKPDLNYPGVFNYTQPMFTGKKNKHPYTGTIILLCNETTQSHAEFTLMALQTFPKCIIIGSQTAGADGNVSYIPLPGGYHTIMTGIGVFYPDGRPTQRIGIVPDIVVQPSISGIRAHRDEVLEKALEYIRLNVPE